MQRSVFCSDQECAKGETYQAIFNPLISGIFQVGLELGRFNKTERFEEQRNSFFQLTPSRLEVVCVPDSLLRRRKHDRGAIRQDDQLQTRATSRHGLDIRSGS